jgi:hypothetical protein
MRIAVILLSAALAGCATTPVVNQTTTSPPPPTAPQTTEPSAPPRSEAVERLLGSAGGADAATQDAVRRLIGEPDFARAEGAGALWTYRLEHCALMLAFAEGPGALRLAAVTPGPRRLGEPDPAVSVCAAEAHARTR